MSTITEGCRRGVRFLGIAAAVLMAWFALAALTTLALEPTRTVAVFAPAPFSALEHADARLVGGGSGFLLVQGEHRGFVRQLYAGGGWLVLPALTGGCRGSGRLRSAARES